ncbi:hypothetical protein [Streptoalloteichus hindustanus]|uniref:Uncharacterized protein n=1 Tax=Streptoalloteichus hindustanus TaxID=2017 RepID=A0A1M4YX47_STRHI|nr:hypothetical protein [Streptoalloteichus hindustanus]SHF10092.1 hypothetical protein SAMN05444320_102512 [Streptoalloteichus hindustanus]
MPAEGAAEHASLNHDRAGTTGKRDAMGEPKLDSWGAARVMARIGRLVADRAGHQDSDGRTWWFHPPTADLPEIVVTFGRTVLVTVGDLAHDEDYATAFEFHETAEVTWLEAMVIAALNGGWTRITAYTANGDLVERHAEIDAPGWKIGARPVFRHPDRRLALLVTHRKSEPLPAWPRM